MFFPELQAVIMIPIVINGVMILIKFLIIYFPSQFNINFKDGRKFNSNVSFLFLFLPFEVKSL